jgi:hypothetical protein
MAGGSQLRTVSVQPRNSPPCSGCGPSATALPERLICREPLRTWRIIGMRTMPCRGSFRNTRELSSSRELTGTADLNFPGEAPERTAPADLHPGRFLLDIPYLFRSTQFSSPTMPKDSPVIVPRIITPSLSATMRELDSAGISPVISQATYLV